MLTLRGGPTMLIAALTLVVTAPWTPKMVQQVLKEKGPPLLSARSANLRGERLIATDLDLVEPSAKPGAFKGRVLIYCDDSYEALGLWAATVAERMSRATPLLGHEGPGAKCLAVGSEPVPLLRPARVFVVWVDALGFVRRTRSGTVTEVQLTGGKPGAEG
jgi:hypothetical protein